MEDILRPLRGLNIAILATAGLLEDATDSRSLGLIAVTGVIAIVDGLARMRHSGPLDDRGLSVIAAGGGFIIVGALFATGVFEV